jgi:hypothetical protein
MGSIAGVSLPTDVTRPKGTRLLRTNLTLITVGYFVFLYGAATDDGALRLIIEPGNPMGCSITLAPDKV